MDLRGRKQRALEMMVKVQAQRIGDLEKKIGWLVDDHWATRRHVTNLRHQASVLSDLSPDAS